jgi:ribose/xylose/arabinose/galactoside ABC-type transport system permease subunit
MQEEQIHEQNDNTEILKLIQEQAVLTQESLAVMRENNELLKKIYRHNIIGIWLKLLWFAAIIGLPFAVYFYVLGPYFEAFGSNYEVFRKGMAEIPGLKGIENVLPTLFRY